jgi:hypothetical protein
MKMCLGASLAANLLCGLATGRGQFCLIHVLVACLQELNVSVLFLAKTEVFVRWTAVSVFLASLVLSVNLSTMNVILIRARMEELVRIWLAITVVTVLLVSWERTVKQTLMNVCLLLV